MTSACDRLRLRRRVERVGATALLLAALAPTAAAAKSKPKVAVMPIDDQSGKLKKKVVRAGTEFLRGQLASTGRYVVIDKSRQEAKLKALIWMQKKESYKQCYDKNCQVPLGQALAADTILRTTVTRLGRSCTLNSELVDLAKEATVGAGTADFKCKGKNLKKAIRKVMEQLTGDSQGGSELSFGSDVKIRAPTFQMGNVEELSGIGQIDIVAEERLEAALDVEEDATSTPDAKGAAWCHLAALEDDNPYREKAEEGCVSWRQYSTSIRRKEATLPKHYNTLARYLRLKRKKRAQKRAAVAAFLREYGALESNELVVAVKQADGELKGKGAPKLQPAAEVFGEACEGGGARSCSRLGNFHRTRKRPKWKHAAVAYQKACAGGDGYGCNELGFILESNRGAVAGGPGGPSLSPAGLYETACESGSPAGCHNLAVLLASGGGDGWLEHMELACTGGKAISCSYLAGLHSTGKGVDKDDERAAALYLKACRLGEAHACNELGHIYDEGKGISRDDKRAVESYGRGCDGANATACFNLALMHDAGEGVARDEGRADELRQRACSLGFKRACAGGSPGGS